LNSIYISLSNELFCNYIKIVQDTKALSEQEFTKGLTAVMRFFGTLSYCGIIFSGKQLI